MIYLIAGFFASFFSFFRNISKFKTEIFEFILLAYLIFISTFRSVYVGADTLNYTDFFNNSPSLFDFDLKYLDYLEPGFRFYLAIIKTISSHQEFFLFVSSLSCILPLYLGIKKLKLEYSLFSLALYFFIYFIPYSLNALRQAIAMSIFIYALSFFKENKIIPIIFLTISAYLIHSTGVFILFCYLLYRLDYRKAIILSFLTLLILGLITYLGIIEYLVFSTGGVNAEVYQEKFNETTSALQYIYRIVLVGLIGFFVYTQNSEENKKIFIIYFFGFLFYFSLSKYNMIATRFNMFFRVLEIILIPTIVSSIRNIHVRFFVFLIFLVLALIVFYGTIFLPENIYQFN